MPESLSLVVVMGVCLALMAWHVRANSWEISPGFAAPALWLLVCGSYLMLQASLDPISMRGAMVMIVGIGAFSIGAFCGSRLEWTLRLPRLQRFRGETLPWLLVGLSLLGLLLMLDKALEYWPLKESMPIFGGANAWYSQLRSIIHVHGGTYGLSDYALPFSYVVTAYLLLAYRRGAGGLLPLLLSAFISCGFILLSTGRTFVLLLACLLIAGGLPRARRYRLIMLSLVPVGAFVLFAVLPMLGGRLSLETFLVSFKHYFLGPLAAFDWALNGGLPATGGEMTFRTVFAVLNALGFDVPVADLIQPLPSTKIPANVYAVFSPYYRDFGLAGVFLFLGALGGLHGWVFRQAMAGNALMIVANGLMFFALAMQFFQDQYFSLLSLWMQMIGWTLLLLWLRPLPEALPLEPGPGQIRV